LNKFRKGSAKLLLLLLLLAGNGVSSVFSFQSFCHIIVEVKNKINPNKFQGGKS
jgi:hypothetical protein